MPPDLLHPGDRIAGYRIDRQLGHGATGVVYLARQVVLDRPVALKVVGAPFAVDAAFRERFRVEAQAAAALDHPNVVTVLDSGEDDERLWLAMRLVDGPDLRVLLRRTGRLEPEHAVSIVEQVAAALDAAHAAGLVHRDVKPGNVLVEDAPGGALHAELADFGLVGGAGGAPGEGGAADGADTEHDRVVEGTPEYAAPEQLAGQEATTAADVYGLGRVFAEMLTGDPATPVGPGATGFAAVVARATDPDPAWRYPTPGALAVAARSVLDPERSSASTVPGVAGSLPSPAEVRADAEYEDVEPLAASSTASVAFAPASAASSAIPSARTSDTSSSPSSRRAGRGRSRATTLVAVPRRRRRRWAPALMLVALLGVVAAAALFFGEVRDGMLVSDPAGRSTSTAGGAASAAGGSRSAGSGSAGAGSAGAATAGAGTAGAGSAGAATAGAGSAGSGSAGSGTAGAGTAGAGTADLASASAGAEPASDGSGIGAAAGDASPQPAGVGSSAPPLGGAGPGTRPSSAPFPPARGRERFGGGSWVLDLPEAAGWRQTAVQELSGGRLVLTRLRRDDGARLVVEHRPGQTAVYGPWPGQAFAVRAPEVGRIDALVFRGGRFAMCGEAVCAAAPVNGPSGGVLLIVAAESDVQARREMRRAVAGLRVG